MARCEHDRERSKCRECAGGSFCLHDRIRSTCSQCSPEAVYNAYRRAAQQRGLFFALTLQEFKTIVIGPCAFCGTRSEPRGIDRRDNHRGYVADNCQPACGKCNRLKGAMEERQFLALIRRIQKYQEQNAVTATVQE